MNHAVLTILIATLGAATMAQEETGFVREAAYTDDAGAVIGGHHVHRATGMPVRLLEIESVPQVFIHVNTPPVSDMGEPHTQEHLLLGKGSVGKAAALAEEMSLVESTAYTAQTDTCYSFNCAAGKDTFFRILEQHLEALLFPDYTDEEIRREVWHVGVTRDPGTGELELEERGTIYNEMVTTYEKRWNVFYELGDRIYGDGHPYSYSAGGAPDAIRKMTPADIHGFHRSTYHLSPNMGLIASLPPWIPSEEFLERMDGIITRLAARPGHSERPLERLEVPPIRPSKDRSILRVPYPNHNEQDTGNAIFCWEPRPKESIRLSLLRSLFLSAFASGETSVLQRVLLDTESRRLEVEATEIWAGTEEERDVEAAMIGLSGYASSAIDDESLRAIERVIHEEIERIAGYAPGDEGLADFERRVETQLLQTERDLKRRLSQPPLFGHRRGGGGFWLSHLRQVDSAGGDTRSLTLAEDVAAVRALLASDEANPWAAILDGLGMREAPVIAVSHPSSEELARRKASRAALLTDAAAALAAEAGGDEQAALAKLESEQAAATAALEARDATIAPAHLVPDVPMTFDDSLVWQQGEIGGVPAFRAHFEAMSAVDVAMAFRLEGVTKADLTYLPLLPELVTGAGLRDADGLATPYDALQDLLERETGGVEASYDLSPRTGRHELVLTAAGVDADEGKQALSWLRRCATECDLTVANLPRLRSLVEQASRGLRQRLGGSEESWVRNPAAALRYQRDHVYLSAGGMHTRLHHVFRLQWLLAEWPQAEADAAATVKLLDRARAHVKESGTIGGLAPADGAEELSEAFREVLAEPILESLGEMEGDLPAAGRAAGLLALIDTLETDLRRPPGEVVEEMRVLLVRVLSPEHARMVLTGRPASLDELQEPIQGVLRMLTYMAGRAPPRAADVPAPTGEPVVLERTVARDGDEATPTHFALVNETGSSGVFVFSAAAADLEQTDRDTLVSELAATVYGGGGPHAFFMNTWAAGLAYSNGASVSPAAGRTSYYAERCPDLVQTMQFVVDLAKKSDDLPDLSEYTISYLVTRTRASSRFEARARAQAADLVDGVTPEFVTAYRKALLALRDDPELWADIQPRIRTMTGRTLVGLGARSREQPDGTFLVIAPERLIEPWEEYVQRAEADYEQVHRIYPADFWLK